MTTCVAICDYLIYIYNVNYTYNNIVNGQQNDCHGRPVKYEEEVKCLLDKR